MDMILYLRLESIVTPAQLSDMLCLSDFASFFYILVTDYCAGDRGCD